MLRKNKEACGSSSSGNVCIAASDANDWSLVGFIQLIPDKTATTLTTTAIVTYPVHAIFRNVSA